MSSVVGPIWAAGVVGLIVLYWSWYARTPRHERMGRGKLSPHRQRLHDRLIKMWVAVLAPFVVVELVRSCTGKG